jgi:hypothetical protein
VGWVSRKRVVVSGIHRAQRLRPSKTSQRYSLSLPLPAENLIECLESAKCQCAAVGIDSRKVKNHLSYVQARKPLPGTNGGARCKKGLFVHFCSTNIVFLHREVLNGWQSKAMASRAVDLQEVAYYASGLLQVHEGKGVYYY